MATTKQIEDFLKSEKFKGVVDYTVKKPAKILKKAFSHKNDYQKSEKFASPNSEVASTIINTLKGIPIIGALFEDLDRKVPEWINKISDSERVGNLLRELQSLSAKRDLTINEINKLVSSLESSGFSVSGNVKREIAKAKTRLINKANELTRADAVANTLTDHAINTANQGDTLSEGIRGKGIDTKINKVKESIYAIQEKFK